jgi:hypothetical protein
VLLPAVRPKCSVVLGILALLLVVSAASALLFVEARWSPPPAGQLYLRVGVSRHVCCL